MSLCLLLNSGYDEPNRSVKQILPSCSPAHISVKALTLNMRLGEQPWIHIFTFDYSLWYSLPNFHDHTHIPPNELLADELAFLISNEDPFAPHHCIAAVLLWISSNI